MAKIIMAVGKSLGPYFDPKQPGKQEPEYFEIHAGEGVGEFTGDQVLVWDLARQEPEIQALHKFDRAALEKVVRTKTKIKDPSPHVDFLLGEGVLVEVDLQNEKEAKSFLKKYRLVPTADGYGNSPANFDQFTLGRNGQVLMPISLRARSIWAYSHMRGSVWDGCESQAKGWRKAGKDVNAADFGMEIAAHLPLIVSCGAGVLEPMA
ncbi:hypothetical protein [Phytomonospora endophytica]|uniref:Uncharacterized protein n=1 Tax=Phytomonospora endophytica TaxID=714109 RepID=A0A841FU31_9ACTN|nr:hypothetical protein [Phytomonospora endophytica]MBB6035480.1 hypothetical protein [Phytomonospora endophytica]GIG63767.1 hypothetical protein Pen01_00620 [Phytomonospora endophytica]